jgi:PAS domain-containing protein
LLKSLKFFDDLRRVVYTDTFYPSATSPATQDQFVLAERDFKDWATCFADFDSKLDGYLPRHTFRGMFWTSITLRHRWRVVSASQVPNQRTQSHGTPRSSRSNSTSTLASRDKQSMTDEESTETVITEESDLEMKLADSEAKFKVLTELNPVGMYYLSPSGDILYCNDMCT